MIPVTQTRFKGVDGAQYGNCLRAVLASILEVSIDLVPEFECEFNNGAKWRLAYYRFIAGHGLQVNVFDDEPNTAKPYIVTGTSPRALSLPQDQRFNHAVVFSGGQMIHDPHPSGEGVLQPESYAVFELQPWAESYPYTNYAAIEEIKT